MLIALGTVAPLFITLGLGFAAGFLRKFRDAQASLNTFIFHIGLPALLFSTISTAPTSTGVSWLGLSIAALSASSLSVATYYLSRLGKNRSPAPTALAAAFGNLGFFGIPITVSTVGSEAALPAALLHLVNSLLFMSGYPLARAAGKDGPCGEGDDSPSAFLSRFMASLRRAARILVLNPVVVAITAGLLVKTTPLHMPPILNSSVEGLGQAAVPIALFSVGLALHAAVAGIREGSVPMRSILLAAGVKVLLLPLLTVLATTAAADGLEPTWKDTLILMAAMPSSNMTYVLAEQYDQEGSLAAAVLVTTTAISLFTIPLTVVLFL